MSDEIENDPIVKAALAAKYNAEADKFRAETEISRLQAESRRLGLDRERQQYAFAEASDLENRVYRLNTEIDGDSMMVMEEHLSRWARLDGESPKPMTIIINSPGGNVTAGMDLFDFVLELRRNGHEVTMQARGMAASMAGILLQAASPGCRFMGKEAYLLLHEPSGMAMGSLGEMKDRTGWMEMMTERVLNIYADRCQEAGENGTAEKPFTRTQIRKGWNRTDWWLDSDQALKGGLVDEIR